MAAQCRSPRCTAERKGFRRELDSWRHRLIHCVGFESILEGLYGPGLRRDLSLFDDCEPEELVDWCVDEKCSLCSLRKETVDCTPSGGSAQSTPTGEVISQGQFNTEKIECQAENYLNALFQKKDLPQNCDPNIPLVAQELMKKMIRQFAIEYVSKSRKMYQDNGTMADSPNGCNGIQLNQTESLLQEDQDGPLDLTVTRIQEQSIQDEDGALDLSVKRNGNGLIENSKIKNHKLDSINGYFLRKLKNVMKCPKENTALAKVLATYCLYHRQQVVLLLKFISEEQKTCPQICFSHLQFSEQAISSKRTTKSPDMLYSCTKEKLSNFVGPKKQASSANLPYLSVRLKDLRLTWPNLALGTVKLNPIKHEDLHLRANDPVLHCINTRSRKKKLFICSSRYRAISCSSSLPRLKLQRIATCLDDATVKSDLKYIDQPASPISINNKSCQTEENHKTVTKSSNTKNPSCNADDQQNNLMSTENNATAQSSHDRYKIGSVHFGNLINHLLNNSKSNHFVELLNQDTNNLDNTGMQTRFQRNQHKSPIFGCSVPGSQSLEFTSKLNFSDTFPKLKTCFGKNSRNLTENMDNPVGSDEGHVCDILVMKQTENITESDAKRNKTKLPHTKPRIHSKNVICVKNSQPCLPKASTFSATENVNTHERRSHRDSFVESSIPFKRYSKNILGKCKLCDVSHGQCSFPSNSNLFCKCTIKYNSGLLKNFKTNGLVGRNTTDKARNVHLKVVVERLENTLCSDLQIPEKKRNRNCETRENKAIQSKRLEFTSDQLSINPQTSATSSNVLSPIAAAYNNPSHTALGSKSVTPNSTSCSISENTYFSPIKLMFVSRIDSEDGVKYALSSFSTPFENRDQQLLPALQKYSHGTQKKNAISDCLSQCGNPNNFLNQNCKVTTSSSSSNVSATTQNPQEDACVVRRKLLGSSRVHNHTRKNLGKSHIKESGSDNLDKEMPVKIKNNLKMLIPYKKTKSVAFSKMSDSFRECRTTETYVAKNISSTQIKIKKLHKVLESPVTSDFTDVGLPEDHMPRERENCKISLRFSTRLQKSRKPSTVPNLCVVHEFTSNQEKPKNKTKSSSDVSQEKSKKAAILEKSEAEQNVIQKTKPGKPRILKSRKIRKQTLSNYMTRSKKSSLFALYYGSQSKFSLRRALLHKSKKHSCDKSKNYKKKLRSYKQQCEPPMKHLNSVESDDQSQCTATDPDLEANTAIEWWSTTASNESLLNHLETRYEHIAKTWVTENNVEKERDTQSSAVRKFFSSESKSPIQMLFQKKCNMNDLATWFMQTTETQSLSIVRKANARRSRHITKKRSRRKAKLSSINSSISKKYLNNCSQPTESSTLEELHRASKFVPSESFSLDISKHNCKTNLKMNGLRSSTDKTKDVCVKFSCPGEILDLTNFFTTKIITAAESSIKKSVQLTKEHLKDSAGLGTVQVSTSPLHAESRAQGFSEQHMEMLRDKPPKRSTRCRNKKPNIKECRDFLPKETRKLRSNKASSKGNSKFTVKSGLGINSSCRTKYRLQMSKTSAKLQHLKKIDTLKCRYEMCLRKLRRTVMKCDSYDNSSMLEKRKRKYKKAALYLEKNKNCPKEQRAATGREQSDYTKLQIGPLKPVGFPATRGLTSKFGSYSLTPIRIPLK